MADSQHLEVLLQGKQIWNAWRSANPDEIINLRDADLRRVDLSGMDLQEADLCRTNLSNANMLGSNLIRADLIEATLSDANLEQANLTGANLNQSDLRRAILTGATLNEALLREADLRQADLSGADLRNSDLVKAICIEANLSDAQLVGADLSWVDVHDADLSGADLSNADLSETNFRRANLRGAKLRDADRRDADLTGAKLEGALLEGANLSGAVLISTWLRNANLMNCRVFGVSVWKANTEGAIQLNLVITDEDESIITVDSLEVAQFIHLLIHNAKLRDVIDTIGKKAVLILGRFTPKRKVVLDALRETLRTYNYIPILFDFDKPESRNFTEVIVTLAHLSRFVIADLTDPSSVPQELQAIAPNARSVPIQPIIMSGHRPYAMFSDLQDFHWVLDLYEYETREQLISMLPEKVIAPAEAKANELRSRF